MDNLQIKLELDNKFIVDNFGTRKSDSKVINKCDFIKINDENANFIERLEKFLPQNIKNDYNLFEDIKIQSTSSLCQN